MSKRFIVRPVRENLDCDEDGDCRRYNSMFELFDTKERRVIGVDGGEPEDQLLCRDWRWVENELNKLAEEIENLSAKKSSGKLPNQASDDKPRQD